MRKDLERRIQRLEQIGAWEFPAKLRALARRLGGDGEEYLRVTRGYERQLDRHLPDGKISWEGIRLLEDLLRRSRGLPPRPLGEFG
jgi:hypothetical protein